MRYFIIAGEQSGDLHGSNLVRGLKENDPSAEVFCWGGDLLLAAGAQILKHYKELAFMGFVAVIRNLGTISKNITLCKKQISEIKPDVVIFIDYPGFNLRIAEWARREGFRTFYYISPKLWAWNEGRVEKIKKYIDRMYIIFPFEVAFYRKHGITVEYLGNPLVDETERRVSLFPVKDIIRRDLGIDGKPVIALLAGSRKHEIELVLPQMMKIIRYFPDHQFILAGVKNIPDELYMHILGNSDIRLLKDKTYEILHLAEAALVTSGTATLEAAIMNTPQVVCYKGDFFSMLIAWMVIRVKYISLVNLIMESEVIRELVQYDLTEKNLLKELKAVLKGGERREKILADYQALNDRIGPSGASGRVARKMVNELKQYSE
ncbi:MAG: lipid-A-disaccharide synthase [Bacteroidetes bacterium GWE2_41_25]|nr:MAG: lipid-A-disaccharide synthase [Bacteroidetes bacterium GWA2_40_15]OFX91929.1 MAG: lipid-A-disaccharide synthase [Bacteroidetes bacterium GWE2_41_25]OFX95670.1 MAG: lipid-A-disaccharide synthase [Bacteroidetes bacterium GWC2_40_22]OFY57655.1 MAG: lipid-A-disaccharide synthase [Bacteroidetes bacterium GWF2_41_9]HAM10314.1 lipid-A-disaccharide synthase [Bacteroidales bacterium]